MKNAVVLRNGLCKGYFIDTETAEITDENGNIQQQYISCERPCWHGYGVHQIQAYSAWGFKKGYDIHHIDENKQNNALSNLIYLTRHEHVRLHALGRQTILGWHFYNNGKIEVIRPECPEGFVEGRLNLNGKLGNKKGCKIWNKGVKATPERLASMSKCRQGLLGWTNGVVNVFAKECPGPEWRRGRTQHTTKLQRQHMSDSHLGFHWWNNGTENKYSKECPKGFVRGRLKNV